MNRNNSHLLLAFIFIFTYHIHAQENIPTDSILIDTLTLNIDIFEEEAPIYCTLSFDIKKFTKEKRKGEYQEAKLKYLLNDSVKIEKTVRLKARGNFRRDHCAFPPVWINIKKSKLKNEFLSDVKKLKIVTHCKYSTAYEPYILKEFIAYKLYNILTPNSFRVRLMRITYIDEGRKNKAFERWGFLIEHENMLAERLDAIPIKREGLPNRLIDTASLDLMAMFNYMIGNTDYHIPSRHNIKLIKFNRLDKPYPIAVPYDFDYSGLVDTYYAIPREELGTEKVTERVYLGQCRADKDYQAAYNSILKEKERMLEYISGFEYLKEVERDLVINYINSFFSTMSRKNAFQLYMNSTCKK